MKSGYTAATLTVVFFLVLAGGAAARHRHRASEATAGEFDYYLLSLSWSPAFCLQDPGAYECNGPRRYGFLVHGLWPQNERGWPENCGGDTRVPDAVVGQISDLMPARKLVYHEWTAHGTCSGLSPADFFALVRRAYAQLAIPPSLVGPRAAIEQTPAGITAAFLQSNRTLPANAVAVTCSGQDVPRLREVHVCFDRELRPRACSPDALQEGCRADSLIVPPIR